MGDMDTLGNFDPSPLSEEAGVVDTPIREGDKKVKDRFGLIREVGEACFGPNWRTSMAEVLGITARTLSRWESEQVELTTEIWDDRRIHDKLRRCLIQHDMKVRKLLDKFE